MAPTRGHQQLHAHIRQLLLPGAGAPLRGAALFLLSGPPLLGCSVRHAAAFTRGQSSCVSCLMCLMVPAAEETTAMPCKCCIQRKTKDFLMDMVQL